MNILFHVENNDNLNFCEAYKIINGKRTEIVKANIIAGTGISFTNQSFGRYSYSGAGEYSLISPEGIYFLGLQGS